MKKRILSLAMVLTLLLLLCSCGEEETVEADDSTPVEVATVAKTSISSESSVSGQVTSGTQESVSVALSVRCTQVYVEAGDYVTAGQTICTLDMASTWANYETAQKSYETARKSYNDQATVLSQQVAMAEKNVSDTQALFEIGAASQIEVDNAKLQYESAKASMNSALSQLELSMQNAQASLTQLESSLANIDRSGNVVAPISGNILSLNAAKNSFVSPGMPVATIDSTTDMEVTASVSEALVTKLSVGSKVNVSISSAGKEFQATISALDHSANPQTHLYQVTIAVPSGSASGLLSGMFADVTFYTDTQNNVVVIPTEAIQTGMDGQYVYTLDSNDKAHKVPVETGLVGDGVTEITSGLVGGERLVTVGQFYLSEGASARVVSGEV